MPGPWVTVRGAIPGLKPESDPGMDSQGSRWRQSGVPGKPKAVRLSIVVIEPNASAAGRPAGIRPIET